jgi:hypothetical protein
LAVIHSFSFTKIKIKERRKESMSINVLSISTDLKLFPADKNVRVYITGLVLCDFIKPSVFRFLRKVPHHQFLMTIVQRKRSDGNYKKILTIKFENNEGKIKDYQNIEILGADNNSDSNQLDNFLNIQAIHGTEVFRIEDDDLENDAITKLTLQNCNFFTYKLTENKFLFDDANGTSLNEKEYCEILGGDMSFSNNVQISINNSLPLILPIDRDFIYEITFNNSCDSSSNCGEEEDFKYFYEIVRETANPHRRFKMIKGSGFKSIGTGACLPACKAC